MVTLKFPSQLQKIHGKTAFFALGALVLVTITGISYFKYYQAQQQIAKLSTLEGQQKIAQQEVDTLLEKLSKRMILPDNEKPTVATVTDVETLKKDQPFFEKAQNGDKVLVYVAAKKAIVYRPENDLIVNVGFIAVDGNKTQVPGTTLQSTLTVDVRNGTQTSGLGQKIADGLKDSFTIQKIGDAKNKGYSKTIVVDFGKSSEKGAVEALAKSLNAEVVTSLPEGESSSQAQALVIIGTDKAAQ